MSTRNSLDYFLLTKELLTLFNQIKYSEYLLKKEDHRVGYHIAGNFLSPSLCLAVKTELPKSLKMQLTLLGPTLYPYVCIKEIDKNSD